MKMRDLEARTGVNRETIRVYLRHGLIPEPLRPKPNSADYDESHIRAIQSVRDLQKNSTLTLKQIHDAMQGDVSENRIDASAFPHLEQLVATRVGIDVQPVLLASLATAFPDAPDDAARLAAVGIIDILESSAGPSLSITDARIVTIWSEMRLAGYTEETGFVPEMLTFYLEPADTVASREASLFLERTKGRISEEEAAVMLQLALRVMLDFFGLIRMKRFMSHIREGDTPPLPERPKVRVKASRSPD